MSAMGYIHYLCETENMKELVEEVGNYTIAEQFMDAHKQMRENRNKKEYSVLNEITDKSIEKYKKDEAQGRIDSKKAVVEINNMIKDVRRAN